MAQPTEDSGQFGIGTFDNASFDTRAYAEDTNVNDEVVLQILEALISEDVVVNDSPSTELSFSVAEGVSIGENIDAVSLLSIVESVSVEDDVSNSRIEPEVVDMVVVGVLFTEDRD